MSGTGRQTKNQGWTVPTGPVSAELHALAEELKDKARTGDRKEFGEIRTIGSRLMDLVPRVTGLERAVDQATCGARGAGGGTF